MLCATVFIMHIKFCFSQPDLESCYYDARNTGFLLTRRYVRWHYQPFSLEISILKYRPDNKRVELITLAVRGDE